MDPTANLKEQLIVAKRLTLSDDDNPKDYGDVDRAIDGERLAELVLSLHRWISDGGMLPLEWER